MADDERVVEHVEAETIDVPEVISGADRWLAEQRARVEAIAGEYRPHEIETGDDYRDSKRARAQARKEIKAVEDARRAQVGAIKDAVRDFEASVRDLLEPLKDIDGDYKRELAAWESMVIGTRAQMVEAWYDACCGDVATMVPFRALWDRWAAEGKWDRYGTSEMRIRDDVSARVDAIEADLAAIGDMGLDDADAAEVKSEYVRTLDMGAATRAAAEARRRKERIARAEAERQRREREAAEAERRAAEARERAEREARERREAAEAERRAASRPKLDTRTVLTPEQYADELAAVSPVDPPAMPPTVAERVALTQGAPAPGSVPPYVFCGYGTAAQAEAFAVWCEAHGVDRFTKIPTDGRMWKLTTKGR